MKIKTWISLSLLLLASCSTPDTPVGYNDPFYFDDTIIISERDTIIHTVNK